MILESYSYSSSGIELLLESGKRDSVDKKKRVYRQAFKGLLRKANYTFRVKTILNGKTVCQVKKTFQTDE